jgi:flagellar biogenesis protein FliO
MTGWSNSEDYLSLLIIALIIILILLIRKIRSVIRQRERAYKLIFNSERRSSPMNEGSLMEPPPYPVVESA